MIRIPVSGATHRTESVGLLTVGFHHVLYDVDTEFPSALGRLQGSESQRVRPEAEAASAAALMSSFSVLKARYSLRSIITVAGECSPRFNSVENSRADVSRTSVPAYGRDLAASRYAFPIVIAG